MTADIRAFTAEDHGEAFRLWSTSDGVGLSDADSLTNVTQFLARNPSLSFVAVDHGAIVGTILCGHDGRRGLIHHLVVSSSHRRKGLARALVARALTGLCDVNVQKCHLLVFRENEAGQAFWAALGAEERVALGLWSMETDRAV